MDCKFKEYEGCMEDLLPVMEQLHFWGQHGETVEPEDARSDLNNVHALRVDSDDALGFLMTYASTADLFHQMHGAVKLNHLYVWLGEDTRWVDADALLPQLAVFKDAMHAEQAKAC